MCTWEAFSYVRSFLEILLTLQYMGNESRVKMKRSADAVYHVKLKDSKILLLLQSWCLMEVVPIQVRQDRWSLLLETLNDRRRCGGCQGIDDCREWDGINVAFLSTLGCLSGRSVLEVSQEMRGNRDFANDTPGVSKIQRTLHEWE